MFILKNYHHPVLYFILMLHDHRRMFHFNVLLRFCYTLRCPFHSTHVVRAFLHASWKTFCTFCEAMKTFECIISVWESEHFSLREWKIFSFTSSQCWAFVEWSFMSKSSWIFTENYPQFSPILVENWGKFTGKLLKSARLCN